MIPKKIVCAIGLAFFLMFLLISLLACKKYPEKEPSYDNMNDTGRICFYVSLFCLLWAIMACFFRI